MTFAEFERLPDPKDGRYELHHGEVVTVPFPKHKHYLTQRRLRLLLEPAAGSAGVVDMEIGFRAVPEHEYRVADVAFVAGERWRSTDPEGYVQGAPEIVIEVLSPSNTAMEILDKEKLCLDNGCREFWVVDIDRRQVKVSTPDGHTVTYRCGQEIPLMFGPAKLAVDAIFD